LTPTASRLESETPGLKLARVDVVRILLMRALSHGKPNRKSGVEARTAAPSTTLLQERARETHQATSRPSLVKRGLLKVSNLVERLANTGRVNATGTNEERELVMDSAEMSTF